LDRIVAAIYDRYHNIKLILSGSDTGMLGSFLGQNNARAPLYGRAVYEMSTHRLTPEQGRQFLLEGSKQTKNIFKDNEISEAIAALDGIIGWLTKYGWYRIKHPHKKALRKTVEEGKYVIKEEFLKFASRAEQRYTAIVKLTNEGAEWSEIKQKLSLSDKQLNQMLKRLVDYGYLFKEEKQYKTADPILKVALQ
jgi:AAA+ ATPase superfamily predicted ATPase